MKKLLALFLVMIMSLSIFTGCFFGGESVTGREGAMLALANERLKGGFTGNNSLFGGAEEDLKEMADLGEGFAVELFSLTDVKNHNSMIDADNIVPADRNNTQFNEAVLRSVDLANKGANYIKDMKENVRVLDTWVEVEYEKLLLHVEENSELLLCENSEYNESFVCYRTRDEQGVERYELYTEARDTGFAMRAVYIKDKLYEYTEIFADSISGSENYIGFTAENVDGVWECMESRYFPDNGDDAFDFRYVIFTDEICFAAGIDYHTKDIGSIFMSTSDRKTDIMTVMEEGNNQTCFILQLGAFSGYDGYFYEDEHEGYIVLKDGRQIHSYSKMNENVRIGNITRYDSAWGTEVEMSITIQGNTIEERRNTLKALLREWGLECVESIDKVFLMLTEASEIANEIHENATWHGERINDMAACYRALDTENSKFDFLVTFFKEYKDREVVKANMLNINSPLISFAALKNVNATISVADDGFSFTISDAVATVNDLTLFTVGDEYHLAVGLQNEGGIVHLDGYEKTYVKCEGSSITLTLASGTVDVSKIASGAYDIVVYASTSDGIRSSASSTIGKIVIP